MGLTGRRLSANDSPNEIGTWGGRRIPAEEAVCDSQRRGRGLAPSLNLLREGVGVFGTVPTLLAGSAGEAERKTPGRAGASGSRPRRMGETQTIVRQSVTLPETPTAS